MRAVLREKEPENRDIPWYPWDDAAVVDDGRESELGEDEPRDEIEVEREAGRGDGALGVRRGGTASPNGEEQRPNVMMLGGEDVVVHVPVVSATTSLPIVMRPVTTVATSASSTATMVTPSMSTRATPGFIRPLFGAQPPPRLVLGRDFRAHVDGRDGWAYYSEHYVQGVRGARERQSAPMIDARAEPPRLPAASREQARQRWYTPAQNYDEIRHYDSASSSSYMGLGTDSGEDTGVLQHLEARRRQWQDRESTRVYEAERSEREEAASRAAREREHRGAAQRLSDAHASKNLYAVGNISDSGRARQRDKSEGRRARETRCRDYSESSVESDFSGRKRRVAGTSDKDRNNARRTGRASPVPNPAGDYDSDSDSEVDVR